MYILAKYVAAENEGNAWNSVLDNLTSLKNMSFLRPFLQIDGLFYGLDYANKENIGILQDRLNEHRDEPLKVDGIFGSGTAKALLEYVKEYPDALDNAHFTFLRKLESKLYSKDLTEFDRLFSDRLGAPSIEDIITRNNEHNGSLLEPGMIERLRKRPQARVIAQKTIDASIKHGVDSGILASQFWQESRFGLTLVSSVGAKGITQFMPKTGAKYDLKTNADFFDMDKSIDAGARHMRDLYDSYGNYTLALAAYNGGGKSVEHVTGRYIKIGQDAEETPERWLSTMQADRYAKGITEDNQNKKRFFKLWASQTLGYAKKIMPELWPEEKAEAALRANTIMGHLGMGIEGFQPKQPKSYTLPSVPAGISFSEGTHRIKALESQKDTRNIQLHLIDGGYLEEGDAVGATGPKTRKAVANFVTDQIGEFMAKFDDVVAPLNVVLKAGRSKRHHLQAQIDAGVALSKLERLKALVAHLGEAGFPVNISKPGHLPAVTKILSKFLTKSLEPALETHPSLIEKPAEEAPTSETNDPGKDALNKEAPVIEAEQDLKGDFDATNTGEGIDKVAPTPAEEPAKKKQDSRALTTDRTQLASIYSNSKKSVFSPT